MESNEIKVFADNGNEPLSEDNIDRALACLRLDIIFNLDQISQGVTNEVFIKELDILFFRFLNLGYCGKDQNP